MRMKDIKSKPSTLQAKRPTFISRVAEIFILIGAGSFSILIIAFGISGLVTSSHEHFVFKIRPWIQIAFGCLVTLSVLGFLANRYRVFPVKRNEETATRDDQ